MSTEIENNPTEDLLSPQPTLKRPLSPPSDAGTDTAAKKYRRDDPVAGGDENGRPATEGQAGQSDMAPLDSADAPPLQDRDPNRQAGARGGTATRDGGRHPSRQSRSRSPQPRDAHDRARGKRLFGNLLGTLAKANRSNDTELQRRRAEIERKQQIKNQQQQELQQRQARESEIKRLEILRRLQKVRRQEHWDFERRVLKTKHEQAKATANFLVTKTEPRIYFRPKLLLSVEEEIVEDQIADVEDQIEDDLADLESRQRNHRNRGFPRDRPTGRRGGGGDVGGRRNRRGGGGGPAGPDSWSGPQRGRGRDIDYTAGARYSSRSRSRSRGARPAHGGHRHPPALDPAPGGARHSLEDEVDMDVDERPPEPSHQEAGDRGAMPARGGSRAIPEGGEGNGGKESLDGVEGTSGGPRAEVDVEGTHNDRMIEADEDTIIY